MEKQTFVLATDRVRLNALNAVRAADDFAVVTVRPKTRSTEQNAKFHALCSDIAKSGFEWAGKPRTLEQWKVLLVSGHAIATKEGAEMVPGIENEFVNIRESTSRMTVARASSLIEYTLAFCASNGIEITETRKGGFMEDAA